MRDHGDEQIDKPKIEHDETSDEKEARYEELRVDHVVHQPRPLRTIFSVVRYCGGGVYTPYWQ